MLYKLVGCFIGVNILVIACSREVAPTAPPVSGESWPTYRSEPYRFEVRYPSGGRIIEVPEGIDSFVVEINAEGTTPVKRLAIVPREIGWRDKIAPISGCQTPEASRAPYWDYPIYGEEVLIGQQLFFKQQSPYTGCRGETCKIWTSYTISRASGIFLKKETCVSLTIYTIATQPGITDSPTPAPTPILEHSLADEELLELILSSFVWVR